MLPFLGCRQRAQTEKQRLRALAREGGDLNRATSWAATGRRTGPGATEEPTFGRPRANSMPAHWEHRRGEALPGREAPGRKRGERPRGDAKDRARGEDAERGFAVDGDSGESSPEDMLTEAGRRTSRGADSNRDHYEARGAAHHYGDGTTLGQLGGSGATSTREGEADRLMARRHGAGGSGGSSVRSSPSREEEGSELADSDWAAPRPPRGRPSTLGRGPLSC